VREMLQRLQGGRGPNWVLGAMPGESEFGDFKTALFRTVQGQTVAVEGRTDLFGPERAVVHVMDHGIIVRGPHPDHPGRLVMIMAGPHSLGTGAACLAATRSVLIRQIKAALPHGADIADKKLAFWALVRGEASRVHWLLDLEGVTVLEAGVYE